MYIKMDTVIGKMGSTSQVAEGVSNDVPNLITAAHFAQLGEALGPQDVGHLVHLGSRDLTALLRVVSGQAHRCIHIAARVIRHIEAVECLAAGLYSGDCTGALESCQLACDVQASESWCSETLTPITCCAFKDNK